MLFYVAYSLLIEPKTIGGGYRYTLYIVGLPTLFGLLALGYSRRQTLKKRLAESKGFLLRAFLSIFHLLEGLLFSYLSFGQLAKMGWDYANTRAAEAAVRETIECPVTRFRTKRRPYAVDYRFHNRDERFWVSYSWIREYKDEDPGDYSVEIEVRKGIWNYYIVDSWELRKNN